jgi:hypothetical protein
MIHRAKRLGMRYRIPESEVLAMSKHDVIENPLTQIRVGDEVLYHSPEKWCAAEVLAVRKGDELSLVYNTGVESVRQRSTHGPHLYGWLTYAEAAAGAASVL